MCQPFYFGVIEKSPFECMCVGNLLCYKRKALLCKTTGTTAWSHHQQVFCQEIERIDFCLDWPLGTVCTEAQIHGNAFWKIGKKCDNEHLGESHPRQLEVKRYRDCGSKQYWYKNTWSWSIANLDAHAFFYKNEHYSKYLLNQNHFLHKNPLEKWKTYSCSYDMIGAIQTWSWLEI